MIEFGSENIEMNNRAPFLMELGEGEENCLMVRLEQMSLMMHLVY